MRSDSPVLWLQFLELYPPGKNRRPHRMGRGTGRRGSFCDPFAAEAVKASRRPNRRLIQGGEGWLRGRSVLWHNRQYNACCQKPLSRDFENHRPASEGAWLVSIGLFGSCHKATQRSRQVKGLCAAGRPPLYLLMPAGRSGALGPKVSCGHTLSFGSRGTDGETSGSPCCARLPRACR